MNGIEIYYDIAPEVFSSLCSWSRKKTFSFLIMIFFVVLLGVVQEELANGPRLLPTSELNGILKCDRLMKLDIMAINSRNMSYNKTECITRFLQWNGMRE